MTSVKCVDGSARGYYWGLKTVDGRLPFDSSLTIRLRSRFDFRSACSPSTLLRALSLSKGDMSPSNEPVERQTSTAEVYAWY